MHALMDTQKVRHDPSHMRRDHLANVSGGNLVATPSSMSNQQAASLQPQPSAAGVPTGLTSGLADLGQTASSTGTGDVDMQNAEASADSASSPITQQVCL